MEAVDTIKQMNDCSDSVLKSLVVLNKSQSKHLLSNNCNFEEKTLISDKKDGIDCESTNRYKTALILKLVIQMPLNVSIFVLIQTKSNPIH